MPGILSEYRAVLLRPKFALGPEQIEEALLDQIHAGGTLVATRPLALERLPDPDDEPFLEAALAGPGANIVRERHRDGEELQVLAC